MQRVESSKNKPKDLGRQEQSAIDYYLIVGNKNWR